MGHGFGKGNGSGNGNGRVSETAVYSGPRPG